MGIIFFFVLFSCFLCIISHETESPLASPPSNSQTLTFIDQKLATIYPTIQSFKNSIISDPLGITKTWVGSDICNYKGFYCDNPPDNSSAITLSSVDFNGFRLTAPTLDGFIEQLPDLAIFHANTNFFSGTISSEISNLPYLYELDISNNNFSGIFPISILNINNLSFLDIRYNFFSGSIPPQLFMQTLDVLFLNNNNFMQQLPQTLGNTPSLFLTLANNKFTGTIPRSIGNAASTLIEVLFLNNLLTGCLPHELGFLRKSTVIDVGNNLLTGPLPCSLGCLAKIEQLNFAGNSFYGQVPEVVCRLESLVNFSLAGNYFTGVGPACRNLIGNGVLDVRKNCIRGLANQRSETECAMFLMHRRYCAALNSYNLIPCMVSPSGNSPRRSKTAPVTYNTLSRRRL